METESRNVIAATFIWLPFFAQPIKLYMYHLWRFYKALHFYKTLHVKRINNKWTIILCRNKNKTKNSVLGVESNEVKMN